MILILTAVCNDKLLILQEHHSRQELIELRRSSQFFCPACRARVILKVGTSNIPHFAHLQDASCSSSHEPETMLHLLGKSRLHSFFRRQNQAAALEQYLPQIKQRPDLLACGTAIEFQCSVLPVESVQKRSDGYRSINLDPVWIRGTPQIPLAGLGIFQIRAFEQQMFRSAENNPYLLNFHPQQSLFSYYSNLVYLQGNRWIGKASLLEARRQVYPFAVPKLLSRSEYRLMSAIFQTEKNKFIRSQLFAKNRMRNPFWRLSYELQVDKQKLPAILGVPLPSGHSIKEHPLIWQMKAAHLIESERPLADLIDRGMIKAPFQQRENILQLLQSYETIYNEGKHASVEQVEDICYGTLAKAWEN